MAIIIMFSYSYPVQIECFPSETGKYIKLKVTSDGF